MALHVIKTHWNQAAGNGAVLTAIHLRRAPGPLIGRPSATYKSISSINK